jgi:hypothetical protein
MKSTVGPTGSIKSLAGGLPPNAMTAARYAPMSR